MKRILLIFAIMFVFVAAHSQENMFSLSGGYVFTGFEEIDESGTGWRINAVYELNPNQGPLAHGFAFGYLTASASEETSTENSSYKGNSYPIYYAPKFMIGKGNLKLFAKGALGMHITGYTRTGSRGELKSTDMGFYGGLGGGIMLNLGEKLFVNAEYEWIYMSNSWYRDGFVNSAMGGIGIRF